MKKKIPVLIFAILSSIRSNAQCTFTSTVPYFENFSSITTAGQLPTCWAVSNSTNCQTVLTPTHLAVFYSYPTGTNYYYTNGIQLNAGVIYTISLTLIPDTINPTNWTNLAVMMGTTQAAASQTVLMQTSAISGFGVTPMGTTFSVSTSGIYYSAIRAVANSSSPSYQLAFTDFNIDIPCTVAANVPTVSVSASSNTVCTGKSVTLTASGADTYTWTNGSNAPAIISTPTANITGYVVVGSNSLTGCMSTANTLVYVAPYPVLSLSATGPVACVGASIGLVANGASTYSWNTGALTKSISIVPSSPGSTAYTVTGTIGLCSKSATAMINALAQPTVQVSPGTFTICRGKSATVQLSGANTYSLNGAGTPSTIVMSPTANTTYTVIGEQVCISPPTTIIAKVVDCTGIESFDRHGHFNVFPNPSTGQFTIEMDVAQKIEVFNVTGQLIFQLPTSQKTHVDLSSYPSGFYLLKNENGEHWRVMISR